MATLPCFLVEDEVRREDGESAAVELGAAAGSTLLITLGITRIIEQESLDVSLWGSADGAEWSAQPLLRFPQKFYCGTYSMLLDLSEKPEVKFLRIQWKMNRWGRGEPKPLFSFYLFAEKSAVTALKAANS
ncbi:MAG: hypothetical protein FJW20_10635 [Acidimicrobiia bacterium]|nr:hypothetical protein [Acidimicrobiia bacterium]